MWKKVFLPANEAVRLNTRLLVVPTARARRERYAAAGSLAVKILTMDEFESRLAVVPGRVFVDETTRLLLLRQASGFEAYESLGIPRDFLVFLEHAPFFLRFFDELAVEGVEPGALLLGDSYAEYDEHVAVLKTLQTRYRALLDAKGYADTPVLTEAFKINTPWLMQFESIEVVIEGALSRFERALLQQAAQHRPLILNLTLSPFDQKTAQSFAPLPLKPGHRYRVDLSAGTLLEETALDAPAHYRVYGVKERLWQAAALQQAVFDLADRGFDPARIGVVLPDESFAPLLKRFDKHRIFNFAMGFSFRQSGFYALIEGLYDRLRTHEPAVKLRFERLCAAHETLAALSAPFFQNPARQESAGLLAVLEPLLALAGETERPVAQEAFFELKTILGEPEPLSPKELLHLFTEQLKNKSFDDTGGGAVTVMGVLETRAVSFEVVIVADFNEGFAPKESVKDMFLSAQVREKAGLPTRADRADLQRSLYWRLFARARERVIFCTHNETAKPSRFLKELGIHTPPEPFTIDPALLFTPRARARVPETPVELTIDLTQKPLSPSMFKSYLVCKRQFYYRYIARLRSEAPLEIPSAAQQIGTHLHAVLAACFKNTPPADAQALKTALIGPLQALTRHDTRLNFETALWEKRLDRFCRNEAARLQEGWRPFMIEESLSAPYQGVVLGGRIDRADRLGGAVWVLDYKSGTPPEFKNPDRHTDFQLVFYRLLLQSQGYDPVDAGYYDLENGEIVPLETPEPYEAAFNARLEAYKKPVQNFQRCESRTPCRFCEFQLLCGRTV